MTGHTSIMLRVASRRAAGFGERMGRSATHQLQSAGAGRKVMSPVLSTTTTTSSFRNSHSYSGGQLMDEQAYSTGAGIPEPLPMVAYDYEDPPYDDETDSVETYSSSGVTPRRRALSHDITPTDRDQGVPSFHARRDLSSGPSSKFPPSLSLPESSSWIDGGKVRKFGGGGGGGRHCCPKCGTTVTFRHGDFDENTFYCAACSGWFVANPNTIASSGDDDHNKSDAYEELMMKNGTSSTTHHHNKTSPDGPEIIMQHVSQSRGRYGFSLYFDYTYLSRLLFIDSFINLVG